MRLTVGTLAIAFGIANARITFIYFVCDQSVHFADDNPSPSHSANHPSWRISREANSRNYISRYICCQLSSSHSFTPESEPAAASKLEPAATPQSQSAAPEPQLTTTEPQSAAAESQSANSHSTPNRDPGLLLSAVLDPKRWIPASYRTQAHGRFPQTHRWLLLPTIFASIGIFLPAFLDPIRRIPQAHGWLPEAHRWFPEAHRRLSQAYRFILLPGFLVPTPYWDRACADSASDPDRDDPSGPHSTYPHYSSHQSEG
ncbi:hypothetical protein EJ04DRAFT_563932 [Polyplosphaeria fusca]|uniref:Uncharacterized protein n=1 Tax=Polyplosphaeria fusca TaxID=682080 RepID=A0A9P4QYI3_9PLEO|nr:hypothetical protein EJ04DRAFT_563932 [Polyplosphaeria fusca]